MAVERIRKGDKVRATDGSGPVMDVLAVSSHLAICAWHDGSQEREAVVELQRLRRVAVQQQAQPQQAQPPQPEQQRQPQRQAPQPPQPRPQQQAQQPQVAAPPAPTSGPGAAA